MEEDEGKTYTERADFIGTHELEEWTVAHPTFSFIQKKVIQSGAKLLVGPRGTGKTHHFRYADIICRSDAKMPYSIFVSFTKYYHLEPYLRTSKEATQLFHSWVIAKILLAIEERSPSHYAKAEEQQPELNKDFLTDFISDAERGLSDPTELDRKGRKLSLNTVIGLLERATASEKRKRSIIMLDDAALVLTPEYMVEFFDIFRSLKTTTISPKASVYPGTTEYGPRFHVDHDAEKVQAWLDVSDDEYASFMLNIARDRLSLSASELPDAIAISLGYAAFGMPRAFITLCRQYQQLTQKTQQQKFNQITQDHAELRKNEYFSLADKMPQYRSIISVGWKLFDTIVRLLTDANQRLENGKNVIFGIENKFDRNSERMLRFLVEAGLMYQLAPVSHGKDRNYARFIPHYTFLIDSRAFSGGRGWSASKMNNAIASPQTKHPIRRSLASVLEAADLSKIELNLPPCRKCGTERISVHQSYCHNCGSKLIEPSIFQECMKLHINDLPISDAQKKRILEETSITTLGEIVSSPDPASELRKAKYIGEKRAHRIYTLAKSVEEDFFS